MTTSSASVPKLTLVAQNALIFRVMTATGNHVGNLKLINAVWKFKAIGYDDNGDVVPGSGPLTEHHNTIFATPDEAEISNKLWGTETP